MPNFSLGESNPNRLDLAVEFGPPCGYTFSIRKSLFKGDKNRLRHDDSGAYPGGPPLPVPKGAKKERERKRGKEKERKEKRKKQINQHDE